MGGLLEPFDSIEGEIDDLGEFGLVLVGVLAESLQPQIEDCNRLGPIEFVQKLI